MDKKKSGVFKPDAIKTRKINPPKPQEKQEHKPDLVMINRVEQGGKIRVRQCDRADLTAFARLGFQPGSAPKQETLPPAPPAPPPPPPEVEE